MKLFIRPNGAAQCLYGEQIALKNLGALDIKRASHVEPDRATPGTWTVDLAPVGGPVIAGFCSRGAALAAEEKWLDAEMSKTHVEAADE